MNTKELADWLKNSEFIHCDEEVDGCGNRLSSRIFTNSNKYYRLEFSNGHPCHKWGEKGYIRGVYEPIEVFKREIQVTETFYITQEDVDEENSYGLPS